MGKHGTRFTGAARVGAIAGVSALAAVAITGSALAADHQGDDRSRLVEGTPCSVTARACVDLATDKAWLIHHGKVSYGPVGVSHGGRGKETPKGTFSVQWKDEDHKSTEFNNAPMPYAVFFAPGGIAFHQGNPSNPSAGCVHLAHDDATTFYDDLAVGDEVQVH